MHLTRIAVPSFILFALSFIKAVIHHGGHDSDRKYLFEDAPHSQPKRFTDAILIIGAAGFLGYHLTSALAAKYTGASIIALDSFNVDYSPAIKRQRAQLLLKTTGIQVHEVDVCSEDQSVFTSSSTFRVIILAATAAPNNIRCDVDAPNYMQSIGRCFWRIVNKLVVNSDNSPGSNQRAPVRFLYTLPAVDRSILSAADIAQVEAAFKRIVSQQQPKKLLRSSCITMPALYGPWDNPNSNSYQLLSKQIISGDLMNLSMSFVDVSIAVARILQEVDYTPMDSSNSQSNIIIPVYIAADREDTARSTSMRRFAEWYIARQQALFPCASECHRSSHSSNSSGGSSGGGSGASSSSSSSSSGSISRLCGTSPWDAVLPLSRQLSSGCRYVVYTISIGHEVDQLHDVNVFQRTAASHCNIAFVSSNNSIQLPTTRVSVALSHQDDHPRIRFYGNWTLLLVDDFDDFEDARKPTRVPKLSPGRFFDASVEYAIYVDCKLQLTYSPLQLIQDQIKPYSSPNMIGLLAVRISVGLSVFHHIDHILQRTLERPSITYHKKQLAQQGRAYLQFHSRFGVKMQNMFDGAYLVHNLRLSGAREFRCDWFEEYQQWADRDQVAQSFVLSKRLFAMFGRDAESAEVDLLPVAFERNPLVTMAANKSSSPSSAVVDAAAAGGDPIVAPTKPIYVQLLPRQDFYWTEVETIAKLLLFPYSRVDDIRARTQLQMTPPSLNESSL